MVAARVLASPLEAVEAVAAELWGGSTGGVDGGASPARGAMRGGMEADKLTLSGVLGKGAWGTVYLGGCCHTACEGGQLLRFMRIWAKDSAEHGVTHTPLETLSFSSISACEAMCAV